MSSDDAIGQLAQMIDSRTAFVGLGNRDRGDDAIGLMFIDDLEHLNPERFLSEEDGLESVLLAIINDKEIAKVVFVDSCDIGAKPGTCALLKLDTIDETLSTHKIPLSMLMALLQSAGKETILFGIQPKSLDFQNDLSRETEKILEQLKDAVESKLSGL